MDALTRRAHGRDRPRTRDAALERAPRRARHRRSISTRSAARAEAAGAVAASTRRSSTSPATAACASRPGTARGRGRPPDRLRPARRSWRARGRAHLPLRRRASRGPALGRGCAARDGRRAPRFPRRVLPRSEPLVSADSLARLEASLTRRRGDRQRPALPRGAEAGGRGRAHRPLTGRLPRDARARGLERTATSGGSRFSCSTSTTSSASTTASASSPATRCSPRPPHSSGRRCARRTWPTASAATSSPSSSPSRRDRRGRALRTRARHAASEPPAQPPASPLGRHRGAQPDDDADLALRARRRRAPAPRRRQGPGSAPSSAAVQLGRESPRGDGPTHSGLLLASSASGLGASSSGRAGSSSKASPKRGEVDAVAVADLLQRGEQLRLRLAAEHQQRQRLGRLDRRSRGTS